MPLQVTEPLETQEGLRMVEPKAAVLWTPAALVTDIKGQVEPLLGPMRDLMFRLGGAGLAAPQIGVGLKFFVTCFSDFPVVINPRVLREDDGRTSAAEGCLTWPGRSTFVARAATVRVEYTARDGRRMQMIFQRERARVFQHESDHLEGRCIFAKP